MHICISDIVKRRLNLTDKFIYGSILPDNIKMATGDRDKTHYIKQVMIGKDRRYLPDIQQAIEELDIEDKETRLGYIAHLVEDLIWFNDFIPTYAYKINESEYEYLNTHCIKSSEEFSKDMYSDYFNSSAYIIEKTNTDIESLKKYICNYLGYEQFNEIVLENLKYDKNTDLSSNIFMTKESIDKYIQVCTEQVEKVILKLLGD